MARFIILVLVAIAAIFGFTLFKMQDTGFINIRLGDFQYETNFLMAGAALLAGILALLILFKIISLLHKFIVYFGTQRKERLMEKARVALSQGLIELAEGRFKEAEKLLLKQIQFSDNPLLAYLSAARAAQRQGEHERRDEYLRMAHEANPDAEIAIGLTKAELQLDHEQYEQALANLQHLYTLSPRHAYVIRLLLKTYRHLADWYNLQHLLPELKKQKLLSHEELHALELESWHGLLDEKAQNNDTAALTALWNHIPDSFRTDAGLVQHYAQLLIELNELDQAEQVLRHTLDRHWSEALIVLYSQLDTAIDNRQLEQIESWCHQHPHNAHLLLALGKRCLNKKLWGKARAHLEASLAIHPMPETYLKLAQLLEQHMDDAEQAQHYYRRGLECLVGAPHHEDEQGHTEISVPELEKV
ncbi:MAG: heme biosynthesis HemY N-terminal domain-containing protein [Gammaproteobacteria bacterium]|nr:heme biosynthesis HemY N-terminal domain-containing protein [Gammaproteobacteria bacterium]